nr:uncharacterized protein LOC111428012 [Onthophagus taurus]
MIHLIFILIFVTSPSNSQNHQDLVRGFALNPAEINNIYFNPTNFNYKKDLPPQPLIRPEATIEETVHEVEELIKKDPKLPRLTRGEIVDIIENITKIGDGAVKNYRDEGKRALMVVMPFTAGSAQGDDIKELYTRTPVTRIIGNEDNKNNDAEKVRGKKKKPPRKWENEVFENDVPKFQYLPSTTQKSSITKSKPASFSFMTQLNNNIKPINFEKERVKTETTTIKNSFEPDVKHTNHNYEMNSGMRVVAPSFLMTMTDDGYSVPYVVRRKPQIQPEVTIEEVKITPDMYGDTPIPKPKENFKITTPKMFMDQNKFYMPKLSVTTPTTSTRTTMTTTTEMNLIKEINKIEENELISIKENKKSENKKEASVILDEISIPNHYKGVIKDLDLLITPENDKIPFTQQILKPLHQDDSLKTPSTSPIPDISNVANNLSPEMKDLLMSFGLINKPSSKKPESSTTTEEIPYIQNVQINPQSYVRFKPLPKSSGRDDMEELLSRFGLGRNRNEKAIDFDKEKKTMKKTSEISDLDVIPDNFKNVVKNLGFNENTIKNINQGEKHIFKPTKLNNTEEELKKLGKLLNMIKDLEEMKGNITEDSLKDFDSETLKELIGDINGNLDTRENFLDPNSIQLNYDDQLKKDFKRQNEKSNIVTVTPSTLFNNPTTTNSSIEENLTESLTTENLTSQNTESTTENVFVVSSIPDEPKQSGLEDLESSFGNVEPQSSTEEITTTTTPRTGFYYLLDWNTFLELDNQNGKRVNLRFQPHAGNPNYFINVQVP